MQNTCPNLYEANLNYNALNFFKKNQEDWEWYTMESVIERKCRGYIINLCKMMFRAQGITNDKLGCCIVMR